ncbi:hypothetical protein [Chelatococcus sp.]|uniref:hypothetical protein n=1 Tax=Chelatococcus sp. TaxID=1953771 RepID=UPI001EC1CD36|nr:hypothetical protein [Chelatococcus sp.]MBX3543756.1 hypothetical protein [Chelatococcus sp.]
MQKKHLETSTATKLKALESRFAAADFDATALEGGASSPMAVERPQMTTNEISIIPEISLTEIDGEPRARDIDIAQRLGFSRPRAIRQIIDRYEADLLAFGSLATRCGELRGQKFNEFWLNEEQALYIASKSDAPMAPAVLTMLIKVFVAWRRGHLGDLDLQSGVEVTKLDEKVKKAIGGMVKRITGRLLREEIAPLITQAVRDAQRQEDMHPTVDLTSTITAADVLDMAQPKARFRGTTQMITREMLKFTTKVGCWRTPAQIDRRQPWRFPREKTQEWLFGKSLGAEMIHSYVAQRAERKAKAALPVDQKVIQFRAPSTSFEGGAA